MHLKSTSTSNMFYWLLHQCALPGGGIPLDGTGLISPPGGPCISRRSRSVNLQNKSNILLPDSQTSLRLFTIHACHTLYKCYIRIEIVICIFLLKYVSCANLLSLIYIQVYVRKVEQTDFWRNTEASCLDSFSSLSAARAASC